MVQCRPVKKGIFSVTVLAALALALLVAALPAPGAPAKPETKKLTAVMDVASRIIEFPCSQCGPGGTPVMLQSCEYKLYLQYPDVKGAKSYDVVVQDKHPRVNTTYNLHAPPFQDDEEWAEAPRGAHRFVGFTGGSGAPPCPTMADFAARFEIHSAVANCPKGCGKVATPEVPPPARPDLPPAPNQNSHPRSAQTKSGKPNYDGVTVTRDGKQYRLTPTSGLQPGDVVATDNNTLLLLEFAIGGRVALGAGATIRITGDRSFVNLNGTTSASPAYDHPLEVQTNGGTLGVRDTIDGR
jgi:hypothetical protein